MNRSLNTAKKRLTPKQRVLRKHPDAYARATTETNWFIYALSTPNKIEVLIGDGMSAREAWANAAEFL